MTPHSQQPGVPGLRFPKTAGTQPDKSMEDKSPSSGQPATPLSATNQANPHRHGVVPRSVSSLEIRGKTGIGHATSRTSRAAMPMSCKASRQAGSPNKHHVRSHSPGTRHQRNSVPPEHPLRCGSMLPAVQVGDRPDHVVDRELSHPRPITKANPTTARTLGSIRQSDGRRKHFVRRGATKTFLAQRPVHAAWLNFAVQRNRRPSGDQLCCFGTLNKKPLGWARAQSLASHKSRPARVRSSWRRRPT